MPCPQEQCKKEMMRNFRMLTDALAHCVRIVVQKSKSFVHKNSPSYETSVYTCMWCLWAPCMYIHFLLTGYWDLTYIGSNISGTLLYNSHTHVHEHVFTCLLYSLTHSLCWCRHQGGSCWVQLWQHLPFCLPYLGWHVSSSCIANNVKE